MSSAHSSIAGVFPRFTMLLALALSLLPAAIQAAALEARATAVVDFQRQALHGMSPVITAAPQLRDLMALAKRATQLPNTCGYIDGNANEMITCVGNQKCTFSMNGLGCCGATTCGGYVSTCYDFTSVGSTCSTCTNSAATYCSTAARAWCATYHYPGGILDFICTNAPATLNMQFSATTTYAPQNHAQPIPGVTGTPVATLPAQTPNPTNSSSSASTIAFYGGLLVWQIALIAVGGFLVLTSCISCCCWRTIRRRRQAQPIVYAQPPIQMQPQQQQQGYYPEAAYQQQTYYPNK